MPRSWFLFAASFLLAAGSAKALDGGYPARADHALRRSTVAIQSVQPLASGKARVSDCTGILIAPDLVLTAGHCLEVAERPEHTVVVGFMADGRPGAPVTARSVVFHPDHVAGWWRQPGSPETRQREIAADMALVRLSRPLGGDAAPIAVAGDVRSRAKAGSSYIAGAGVGGGGAFGLRIAPVGGIALLQRGATIALGSAGGAKACRGDSGGPVASLVDGQLEVWGVTGAVLRENRGCSTRVAIAFIEPAALRSMMARIGR
ncbi:hypothetical protein GCM10007276_15530 [Agaricicola taiwanensis]|uniref:Peptidase S1 domain-containing protein n=1 Tax=Agaricicola taiwanensis TaxID=591372 RepID=A0A8J2VV55_9RHOB|nr:trypsin-like serine protease [Agaricicola taiwanensis]GGE39086.1 hypothetical protein GCM10007276_15530 [Agaricicola taiwanensis]